MVGRVGGGIAEEGIEASSHRGIEWKRDPLRAKKNTTLGVVLGWTGLGGR
jgi:hypothetical protein